MVSIAVIVLSLLYFSFPVANGSPHPKCIFHLLTGFSCPGCGSQRAASALLHGNLLQAIHHNLLLVVSLPFIGYSAFVFSWNTFGNRKIRQSLFYSPVFVKAVLATVLLFWVLRNIPLQPFSWLSP
jgi:hypothetical protein